MLRRYLYGPQIRATEAQVHGSCDARFLPVRAAMRENLVERGELGAAVALRVEGRAVADLWCGWSDRERTRPWRRETVVNAFSVGKALVAVSVLMLVSRGLLELDEPVARHWPQFGGHGKEEVTLAHVLSHRAAVPAISRALPQGAAYDWGLITRAVAEQEPWWTPGAGHGYHVHTFGFILGELVRRTSSERLGAFVRREIADPLELELGFGLPLEKDDRCAEYVFDITTGSREGAGVRPRARAEHRLPTLAGDETQGGGEAALRLRRLTYMNPPDISGVASVNTRAWRDAELPSTNLHTDARSLSRLYAALLDERRPLLERDVLARARREAAAGEDLVLGRPSRFGLGFQLTQPERPLGPSGESFGHFGAGGSLAFADPNARLAFAYLTNRGGSRWQDPRNRTLIDAVYDCLAR